ncbi:ATP-binding protein [Pseudacidovorax intermedius]|uniref:hybrid sensor histidine kinase/response regulator n=1 Tax=Pseudacidovorax intermedius TaxID=433924 RepID=UPI0026ED2EB3|nr:ATP-binding protein [Pseudacidovorax intermedius]
MDLWRNQVEENVAMNRPAFSANIASLTLEQREEQLRLALDAADVGLWDVDVTSNTMYWPARVKAMFGISPYAPATLDDYVNGLHPQDAERTLKAYADAQDPALRTPYDVEYRTIGKEDGVVRWVAAKGRGFFDDQGRCVRAIGTAVDITARKEAEAVMERERERLAFLARVERATRALESAQEVLEVTTRLLGEHLGATRCAYADVELDNDQFTIRADWSPAVPSTAGVYSLELFGRQATSNLRVGRHLVVDDVDRDLGNDGGALMFNAIGIKAIICTGLVKHGRLVAMMAVHQSKPRQWTEEEVDLVAEVGDRCWPHIERVRAAAELRAQDRRKDEFLVTLAHELRNPIAPMLYAIALMKREKDPVRMLSRTGVIERQTTHLVRLVDDLLDVSRISRGIVELKLEVVDVLPLLAQAIEATQPSMDAAGHKFSCSFNVEAAYVFADPSRVVQIVTNVLNNAVKYTPDGGAVLLACHVAEGRVIIEVTDNGLGIPAADKVRLFELFTQLPHTGAKAHGGLGIGLSIVKRLIEMHGGGVEVESEGLGQGSTFRIWMPLEEGCVSAVDKPEPLHHSVRAGRVLVVEDNPDGRRTLVELLAAHGHEVQCAGDGPSALDAARRFKPDVVLLDLGLPGMNGFEVAERMRVDLCIPTPRIIALTGWGSAQDRQRTATAGFDAHVTKPVSPHELLLTIDRWLGN